MKDILTEAEAKERWCPLFSKRGLPTNEEMTYGEISQKCIASQCMAWRLAHKDGPDGQERGYCGAFGIPRFT